MDGQVNELELETATYVRDQQAQLRRYTAAVERGRDADTLRARVAVLEEELLAATTRTKELERNEESRRDSLDRIERVRAALVQGIEQQQAMTASLNERLDHSQAVSTELVGRVEQADRTNAKVLALLKEAVRRETSQPERVTPEHGRQAAQFVQLAARVAASIAPPEYRAPIQDVASAAGRIISEPADRIWRAWAVEAGRFARKCTGAPEPDASENCETPANRAPRYERGVLVPLGDGHVRVQIVGTTNEPECTTGFGVVRGDQLIRARLGIPELLVLLPRRGAGSSYARDVLATLARLDPEQVVEGRLDSICERLDLEATPPTVQSALERLAAISRGVLFNPIDKTWSVDRARLEKLNIAGGTLEIEIARQGR